MPEFQWKGRTRAGEKKEGTFSANSKDAVVTALRRQQIVVTQVKEKGKEFALPKLGGGVSQKDLSVFTRQFSVMIDAGLALVQCLEILAGQQPSKTFKRILSETRADLEGGSSLAEAMKKHPKAFNDLYVNMVAAGEAGGILDTILQRLATYMEKAYKLKKAIKGAMMYPAVVISVATLVVIVILWKVIPTFAGLFEGLGAKLPLPTRIVIWLSRFIGYWWWVILLAMGALTFAMRSWYATTQGRYIVDKMMLKLPIMGPMLRKGAVARFCRTLSTLVSSGVPLLESLDITAKTSGNAVIEEGIMNSRRGVEEGKNLSEPLRDSKVFPDMVIQMIAVGEATGAMDAMMSKIADFYEDEVDDAVANLMSLLEPVIIVFLGLVIGGIVISMYLPMFTLISKVG